MKKIASFTSDSPGKDGRIILKCILKKQDVMLNTVFN